VSHLLDILTAFLAGSIFALTTAAAFTVYSWKVEKEVHE
jgi:hypothetical protein